MPVKDRMRLGSVGSKRTWLRLECRSNHYSVCTLCDTYRFLRILSWAETSRETEPTAQSRLGPLVACLSLVSEIILFLRLGSVRPRMKITPSNPSWAPSSLGLFAGLNRKLTPWKVDSFSLAFILVLYTDISVKLILNPWTSNLKPRTLNPETLEPGKVRALYTSQSAHTHYQS